MRFRGKQMRSMTGIELKEALMEECPVHYNGIEYQKVTALIYRKDMKGTGIRISGELLDQNGRAVVIAPAKRIERESNSGVSPYGGG